MTDAELKRLAELVERATPGPWKVFHLIRNSYEVCKANDYALGGVCVPHQEANAAFIAASREAVPKLLAIVAEQRGRIERLEKMLRVADHVIYAIELRRERWTVDLMDGRDASIERHRAALAAQPQAAPHLARSQNDPPSPIGATFPASSQAAPAPERDGWHPIEEFGDALFDGARKRADMMEETLRSVATALPVLRTMCGAAGLSAGMRKADEMIAWVKEALPAPPRETPLAKDDDLTK